MKLNETKLYEVTAKYVSYRKTRVRIPQSLIDSFELQNLIEQAVYWNELHIPEENEESSEIVDVDIDLLKDSELENYSTNPYVTTDVLILRKDKKANVEFLQLSKIDDLHELDKK